LTNGSSQRIGAFETVYAKPAAILFREPNHISICTSCRYQQIVEYGVVVFTQSYGDNPSIRQMAALDHPTLRIVLLISRNPSCDPKKDTHHTVYIQASGRFTRDNASTDPLDHSGDMRRELSQLVGPNLPGVDIVAVSFGGVADQPVSVANAAKVRDVDMMAGEANGLVNDRRT
jgi:hypothetical protein